ncbi:MAG: AAA family ATPase [Planctomycetota bacterium]|nr:AAA family ATPase [Planctomycetota bacterium]
MAKKPASTSAADGSSKAPKAARKPRAKASDDAFMLGGDATAEAPVAPTSALHPPPIGLDAIVGHRRALGVLHAAIASERVHHAWIFHGPRGVGKFTTALSFAATLLDPSAAPDLSGRIAPDPESAVQRLLRAGTHPDLHIIRKELAAYSEDSKVRDSKQATIAKDVVEEHLLVPAALAPTLRNEGRASKVFIVDEAELLDRSPTNAPVQNAILKTMEEPEGRTVIILVTSNEERLLPTIRSRCQRVAFTPLDDEGMALWLRSAKVELPEESRQWLLRYAAGSPGELLSALESDLFAWQQKLDPMLAEVTRGRFSLELGAAMGELVEGWAKAHVEKNPEASKDRANRSAADLLFRLLSEYFRGVMRRGLASARGAEDSAVAGAMSALDVLRQAQGYLNANVQHGQVMEWMAAQFPAAFAGTLVGAASAE